MASIATLFWPPWFGSRVCFRECSAQDTPTCPRYAPIELNLHRVCTDTETPCDILPRTADCPKGEQVSRPLVHIACEFFQNQFLLKPGNPRRIVCATERIQIVQRT